MHVVQFFIILLVSSLGFTSLEAQCLSGNCYEGQGSYHYPSGAIYEGRFANGKINGYGTLYFSDGRVYEGNWVDHYRQGKGKLTYPEGQVYKGNFYHSEQSGYGVMDFANGDRYAGDWASDMPHGNGEFAFASGDIYQGGFKVGAYDGFGVMNYLDGSRYEGDWKDGHKHGDGTLYLSNGEIIVAIWEDGEMSSSVADPDDLDNEELLSGKTLVRDCMSEFCASGEGKYTFSDGSVYIGSFLDGIPNGEGICYYANGDRYEGAWSYYYPHGLGTMYFANSKVLHGSWMSGQITTIVDINEIDVVLSKNMVVEDPAVRIWAVVVGVGKYEYFNPLRYTDDDAKRFYEFLKSPEGGAIPTDQISLLVDEAATKQEIVKAMKNMYAKADSNDVIVLYYSGHGQKGKFMPIDYDGANNALAHEDVTSIFHQSQAKHKLCIADACHSGTLLAMNAMGMGVFPKGKLDHKKLYEAFNKSEGGVALLLSSKADEVSLEDSGLGQGIFSYFVIKGLSGEADADNDKVVTVAELYYYVMNAVTKYTAGAQHPVLTGEFDKNMPIGITE